MNRYAAIFRIRSASLLQYRAAAFAGVCTQFFWGLIYVMIYKAFYSGASTEEPLTLAQTLTFVWLGQSIMPLLPWRADKMIESQIRSGQVAYTLVRPIHLYGTYYAQSLALKFIPMLMRSFPVWIHCWMFFRSLCTCFLDCMPWFYGIRSLRDHPLSFHRRLSRHHTFLDPFWRWNQTHASSHRFSSLGQSYPAALISFLDARLFKLAAISRYYRYSLPYLYPSKFKSWSRELQSL